MLFSRETDQLPNSSHKARFQVSNSAGLLQKGQPRSQSFSAISDVTSPVKLVAKIRLGRLANNGKSKMAAPSQECDFDSAKILEEMK